LHTYGKITCFLFHNIFGAGNRVYNTTAGSLGDIDDGLPLKVVIILTSMPMAFNALISSSIYDLY
jgi:hypothetical protein